LQLAGQQSVFTLYNKHNNLPGIGAHPSISDSQRRFAEIHSKGDEVGSGRECYGEVTIIATWKDKKAAPCGVAFCLCVQVNYLMDRVELLYMLSVTSTIKPPAG
jgi:hypothetical protein